MRRGTHILDEESIYKPRVPEIWGEIVGVIGGVEPKRCVNCGAWLNPASPPPDVLDIFAQCPKASDA